MEINNPDHAIRYGIGLIPEDRKWQGLILNSTVKFNITLAIFNKLARYSLVNSKSDE